VSLSLNIPQWGEPRSHQRSVSASLAGVPVYVFINVFAVTMDDVFTGECVVPVRRFIGSKAVGIDSQRLLLAVT